MASSEMRNARISAALTGRTMPLETRLKISATLKGRKVGPHSPEAIEKMKATKRARFAKRLMKPRRVIGTCVYCGGPADTLDHIVPRSRGGSNDASNLTPACHSCNASKRELTPEEWRLNQPHRPQNPKGRPRLVPLAPRQLPSAKRTHCPHGHPYSGDNLILTAKGWRLCRTCKRAADFASYHADPEYFMERQRQAVIREQISDDEGRITE